MPLWPFWRRKRADERLSSLKHRDLAKARKAVAEFYADVARALHLPRKVVAAKPPPPRMTREEALREIRGGPALVAMKRLWLPTVAGLLLVLTGAYYAWPTARIPVPTQFLGVWRSRSPGYAGRRIAISTETIEIVAGGGVATGPVAVTSLKVDTTASGIRLRVAYGKPGREQKLEITLHQGDPATLTLLRPSNVVWERLDAPVAPPPGT